MKQTEFYKLLHRKDQAISKYFNRREVIDGVTFDSKREATRYRELKLLEKGHKIKDLVVHPIFKLLEAFQDYSGAPQRAIQYESDFMYRDGDIGWKWVVEDVKGMKTEVYRIKKKFFLAKYKQYVFRESC